MKQIIFKTTRRDSASHWLLLILFLAVVMRLAAALYLGNEIDAPSLLTDQRSYHALGARLLEGQGFSFATGWYPFTPPNTPTAHWSFLQSLYVAGIYGLFGVNPLAVRIVTALLGGLLMPLLSYRLAQRLFPTEPPANQSTNLRSIPLLSALLTALYAYFILYAATLMTETLFISCLLWSLERTLALAEHLRRPNTTWQAVLPTALTLGLALGLAILFRQSLLPWVPLLFLWLLFVAAYHRQRSGHSWPHALASPTAWPALIAAGLVIILCLLPFTWRNYRVYGQFLLLNSNAGFAMYSAQHPMHGTNFQQFTAAPLPPNLLEMGDNEAQWDRALMQLGIQFVRDDPVRYLRLSASRVADYFEFWPTTASLLHNAGRLFSFTLYLPFMLAGVLLAAWRAKRGERWGDFLASPVALALLFISFYTVMHIFTWAMSRYRLPVDAVLMSFAALALVEAGARVRMRVGRLSE